ncbi:MAG TPA: hypothetical protein PLI09_21140 [Candidatus Hydrogenedentes bacterium]|nr:hypothetical protein [Candidatus Hydrogenedentota bacterium]
MKRLLMLLAITFSAAANDSLPAQTAAVDEARYECVLTGNGRLAIHAVYLVRNNQKEFMRAEIGPDTEIRTAAVSGKMLYFGLNSELKKEAGVLLIPLILPGETGAEAGSSRVEFYYSPYVPCGLKWFDTNRFTLPAIDVPVKKVSMELVLPGFIEVSHIQGDFTQVENLPPLPLPERHVAVSKRDSTVSMAMPGYPTETLLRLKDGHHMKLLGAADSEHGLKLAWVRMAAGWFGIASPCGAHAYYFERSAVPENMPLNLMFDSYDRRIGEITLKSVYITAFLWGVCTAYLIGLTLGRTFRWRYLIALVFGMLILGVGYFVKATFLNLSLLAMLGAALLVAGWLLWQKFHPRVTH